MSKPIVAATGLDGLIGTRIMSLLDSEFSFISLSQDMLDITDKNQVNDIVQKHEFDYFLHLAAFTDVDGAESNKKMAHEVNVEGTRNVLEASRKKRAEFIYMSTGFVFDGKNPPYYENSPTNPLSTYGITKYKGEKIVSGKGMTIRIDYPYGGHVSYKKDIVESLIDLLKNKTPFKGIVDQIFTPTYIDDIALAVGKLIKNFEKDTYHIVGSNSLSGYEMIQAVGDVFKLDTNKVEKTTFEEFYSGKAPRPQNSIMKSKKNDFHQMSTFEQGLQKLKARLER